MISTGSLPLALWLCRCGGMSVIEGVAHMWPTCDHFWDIFVDTAESDGWEVAGFAAMSSGGVMAVMMFVVRVLS